jgi:hypothetical protein
MATGNGDAQRLEEFDRALAQVPAGTTTKPAEIPEVRTGDVLTRVDAAASILMELAQRLAEIGDFDSRDCVAFAEHLRRETQEFGERALTRKRRQVAELERILGKAAE